MKMLLVVVGCGHLVRHDGEKLTVALVVVSKESISPLWLPLVGCGEFRIFDQILQPPHLKKIQRYPKSDCSLLVASVFSVHHGAT